METPINEDETQLNNKTAENTETPPGVEIDKKPSEEEGEIRDDAESNKAEEEDVPDDFFDDFSNQDFMDGLDIVDAWDDSDKLALASKENEDKSKSRKRSGQKSSTTDEREKRRRPNDSRRSQDSKSSRDRGRRSRETGSNSSPNKKRNDAEFRRDPLKTKRDLEKDRENYVKKKEQKLISKVIETGLVPPGMEMEADLYNIEKATKDKKTEKEQEKVKKDIPKSKEKSREKSRELRRRRSRSFSPNYRNRPRSIERWRARRERSKERVRRTRSRERSSGRIRDPSPFRRRRRSISDRERWLQTRRSVSPERKYREKMGEEKLSFLEELKMKLDGFPSNPPAPTYPYANPIQSNYLPATPGPYPTHPMPIQAPAPQYFPPNLHSPYDQNFFIGDAQPAPLTPAQMTPAAPIMPIHLEISPNVPTLDIVRNIQRPNQPIGPVPPPVSTPTSNQGLSDVAKLMEQIRATANNVCKTEPLDEKKLSLTDFLTINKKPTAYSTNSEAFKRKINVLSRCQDVLNEFSGDKRPGGKLVVRKCKNGTVPKNRTVSPLLRNDPVQFSYSSLPNPNEGNTFQSALNKVLSRSGVVPEVIISDDEEVIEKKPTVPPPAPRFFKQKNFGVGVKQLDPPIRYLMKMCQTDPISCDECKERKKIKYKDVGIQCGESERYNVGIQVIEADISNSRIPKNQSLAYLTPAQLLGRSEPTSTKIDNFGNPFAKPTAQQTYHSRDPRGYGMYADPSYPGSAIRDPRFPRF